MAHIICTVTNDLTQDQRMDRICTSLSKAGHEVWLIGRQKPGSLPLTERSYRQIRLNCKTTSGKRFYAEFNIRLLLFLLWHRCDIINAIDLDTLVPCSLVSGWRSIPCIYDAHEYFTETPEVVRRPKIQRIWAYIAKVFIPKASICYTVGPQLANIMGQVYGTKFELIRNLPLRKNQTHTTASSQDNKIILYQGMLNEGRGLETAIDAMKQLKGFELWLVGSGDIKEVLEARVAKDEQLKTSVYFHGFVPPSQLASYTNQAWIGLNLLENKGLSYYYSLANKAFDYIQNELPSIHMAFPEYQALQEKYDVFELLDELNSTALAKTITKLADHTERYQQLQLNCRAASKELNWEKEEEKLLMIYDNEVV